MDAVEIGARLDKLKQKLNELHLKSLSLFGSAAVGKADSGSDLDFLVEFEGPATFAGYMKLKQVIEDEFQVRIDLVTRRALKPELRDQILSEAIRVA